VYGLTALRYLEWNPFRAGLVQGRAAYPWSSCAAYVHGASSPLITLHPSDLGLSRYAKVRQRHYRDILAVQEPRADIRDPRWTTERAVGSVAFLTRVALPRRCRRARIREGNASNQ